MLKELIKKLMGEGKDKKEIASAIAKAASKGELKDTEGKALSEINSEAVLTAIKEIETEKAATDALDKHEVETKKKETDTEFKVKVSAEVEKVLANLPAAAKAGLIIDPAKKTKIFNWIRGKMQDAEEYMSPGHKKFADMLFAIQKRDYAEGARLSKEISADNEAIYKAMGSKTPLYSDATTGSYTIPIEVNAEITSLSYELSRMSQLANRAVVVFNEKVYPVAYGTTFAWRTNEATQIGDKTPTIDNPSVVMSQYAAMIFASNQLLIQKGADLVNAFIIQIASANAEFIDTMVAAGSVTTDADKFNGVIFDAYTAGVTEIALANAALPNLLDLKNAVSNKVRGRGVYISNDAVRDAYGTLENANGQFIFPEFINTGNFRPFGKEYIRNDQIPSTLTIPSSKGSGTATRAGGSDDALIYADMSNVFLGLEELRIDISQEFKFDYDQVAWRAIGRMGQKIISGSGSAGVVAAVLSLT